MALRALEGCETTDVWIFVRKCKEKLTLNPHLCFGVSLNNVGPNENRGDIRFPESWPRST